MIKWENSRLAWPIGSQIHTYVLHSILFLKYMHQNYKILQTPCWKDSKAKIALTTTRNKKKNNYSIISLTRPCILRIQMQHNVIQIVRWQFRILSEVSSSSNTQWPTQANFCRYCCRLAYHPLQPKISFINAYSDLSTVYSTVNFDSQKN